MMVDLAKLNQLSIQFVTGIMVQGLRQNHLHAFYFLFPTNPVTYQMKYSLTLYNENIDLLLRN